MLLHMQHMFWSKCARCSTTAYLEADKRGGIHVFPCVRSTCSTSLESAAPGPYSALKRHGEQGQGQGEQKQDTVVVRTLSLAGPT